MTGYATNHHCVEKLIVLSENRSVVATQDIYDESGFKLLAKGAPVSRDMQDRLLMRKLRAPLETSLSVHDGVTIGELLRATLELIETTPLLQNIAGNRTAQGLLRDARKLHIPPPLCLLTSCVRETDPESYRRTQIVVALCAGIAAQLEASTYDAQTVLIAAALHDIGEIYVNPAYLHRQRELLPQEWKHVATHPQVGQILIRELTSLPSGVAACVGQHHERQDGSGYPAQLTQPELHPLSGWIAAADAAAALIERGETDGERISLALRIIPEEFERDAADVLIRAFHGLPRNDLDYRAQTSAEQAQALLERIVVACDELQAVHEHSKIAPLKALCAKTLLLLHGFAKSMRATGILDAQGLSSLDIADREVLTEMHHIVGEVTWRLRHLARNLFLRVDAWNDETALLQVQKAIDLLSGDLDEEDAAVA